MRIFDLRDLRFWGFGVLGFWGFEVEKIQRLIDCIFIIDFGFLFLVSGLHEFR